MSRAAAARLLLLALAAGLAAGPAAADWLLTRAGQRVETRGGWQVKGKLVVFQAAQGELSSLRLAEVDLEASRRATAAAERARQAAAEARRRAPEKRPSVLVLTDDKVRHLELAGSSSAAAEPSPRLIVSEWERSSAPEGGHAVITGTLRNDSDQEATEIALAVELLDDAGQSIATGRAVLTSTALAAGQRSGFRAEFPGFSSYSEVRFDPQAILLPKPEPPPAASGGG